MLRVNDVLCVDEGFGFQLFLLFLEAVKVDNTESDDGGYIGMMDVKCEQKQRWAEMGTNERKMNGRKKVANSFSRRRVLSIFFLFISCVFFSSCPFDAWP